MKARQILPVAYLLIIVGTAAGAFTLRHQPPTHSLDVILIGGFLVLTLLGVVFVIQKKLAERDRARWEQARARELQARRTAC